MIVANKLTNTEPSNTEILVLKTRASKLEKVKKYAHQSAANSNNPEACESSNGILKKPNKSYVEFLESFDSWQTKKTKDNITHKGTELWWCPNHKIVEKNDWMYVNHSPVKHDKYYLFGKTFKKRKSEKTVIECWFVYWKRIKNHYIILDPILKMNWIQVEAFIYILQKLKIKLQ